MSSEPKVVVKDDMVTISGLTFWDTLGILIAARQANARELNELDDDPPQTPNEASSDRRSREGLIDEGKMLDSLWTMLHEQAGQ